MCYICSGWLHRHICDIENLSRVEAHISDRLRDYAPTLERYKAVQIFMCRRDRNQEDCKVSGNFIVSIAITVESDVDWNTLVMSRVCCDRSF